MIVYFSATGNSKYCAEQLASKLNDNLCSLNHLMKENIKEIDVNGQDMFGIVCPAYDFNISYSVAEFIEDAIIKNISKECYVYAVFTCGKSCGAAEKTLKDILKKKGIKLKSAYKIEMPDNYIPMFPLSTKEEQTKILKQAEIRLEEILKNILFRENLTITTKQMPVPMRYLIKKVAVPSQRRATKNFWVKDTCIGCGLCQNICPKNIIELQDGKPVWIKDDCACCLGCIHRCPKSAIQYGKKTEKTGRYTNPNVTL